MVSPVSLRSSSTSMLLSSCSASLTYPYTLLSGWLARQSSSCRVHSVYLQYHACLLVCSHFLLRVCSNALFSISTPAPFFPQKKCNCACSVVLCSVVLCSVAHLVMLLELLWLVDGGNVRVNTYTGIHRSTCLNKAIRHLTSITILKK